VIEELKAMSINRYTPVPPITASADSNDDTELQAGMETWKQHINILKDKQDYDSEVTKTNRFYIFSTNNT